MVTPPLRAAATCDQPAPLVCPVLTPISSRERGEEVVPRVQAASGRGRVDEPHGLPDERLVHRDARELRHVPGARDVAGRVEAVRIDEVGVGEPELAGAGVHQVDEARHGAAPDVGGDDVRGVVGALDERGAEQVADRDPLTRPHVDRRLADSGRAAAHRRDLVERRALERDERRHQLRDRRDRKALAGVTRRRAPRRCRSSGRRTPPRRPAVARRPRRPRGRAPRRERGRGLPDFTRRPPYLTRIRWPIVSETGSTSGLSTSSCSTVVSNCSATSASVSPCLDHVELRRWAWSSSPARRSSRARRCGAVVVVAVVVAARRRRRPVVGRECRSGR